MANSLGYQRAFVRASDSDLTAAARIRNAAIAGFAERGIEATSIRDVAEAAGVSPGLVQHHFVTKAGLRDAVNEYVMAIVAEAFADLGEGGESLSDMGDRVTAFVQENAMIVRYIARALVDGDREASRLFDVLVDLALKGWLEPKAHEGVLHRDTDLEWAALHVVIFNIATVLFEDALNRHLPAPLFSAEQLRRWNVATTDLYRRGLYRRQSGRRNTLARKPPARISSD